MWTGKGEVKLNTKANLSFTKDNVLVIYKLNSDGEISEINENTLDSYTAAKGAVTAIAESFMTINGVGDKFFDDDCTFVTIETDETAGVASDCTYKDTRPLATTTTMSTMS